jgi:uncharacterized membrane protein
MNEAHWHIVINHFPIIGIIFGLGILISGLVFKNNAVINTAYFVFIFSALSAFLSMASGEGAEHQVMKELKIGHKIIHEHEEYAEKFAIVSYLLGIISILGLYFNNKKHDKAKWISFSCLAIAILVILLSYKVGTSGGEIIHKEIIEQK